MRGFVALRNLLLSASGGETINAHRLGDDAAYLVGQLLQRLALLVDARVLIVMLAG